MEPNMIRGTGGPRGLSRRQFVQSLAAAGVGALLTRTASAQTEAASSDVMNVALLGAGSQGRVLMACCLRIPNIRFRAVCDIWPYHQRYAANILKKYDQEVNVYDDYRQMLDKEPGLDAVLIASPDWVHAEHTVACLEAGKHVYCEKEMSNTLDGARQMVLAARTTGKQLQIGHQRRSNPRYHHALKMIKNDKILGRITHTRGQWNRSRRLDVGWPRGEEMSEATLAQYGYASMDEMRNWRWYRKFSGGPIADLGSHQIDIFNWFLEAPPTAVMASGGIDYYTEKGRDWYDNVMAIYEYAPPAGTVRGFYEVLNTTSYGGYYEVFMGDEGSLVISEDASKGFIIREPQAKRKEWENEADKVMEKGQEAIILDVNASRKATTQGAAESLEAEKDSQKPEHQPHLENFFDAVRGRAKLNCDADVAYETAVTVLKVNEAVAAGKRLTYQADEFKV